ncbi:aminoglycoside phosphotransferase family protein [Pseudooceanicola nitratireducens]|uniref:aminoglycoside phosphotransferase family protein n=1 Tax=Pseudooceanicola nitratireducens TaxID=517719 RepID=UPI003514FAF1
MTLASPPLLSDSLPAPAPAFLARQGMAGVPVQGFVADASARSYVRLVGKGALLMDDHHDPAGFAAYLAISDHLNGLGLSAPRVLAADRDSCLALVEDFGDATYARCLAEGEDEAGLYQLAVDALLHLHHAPQGAALDRPVYDRAVHLDELSVFSQWFAPALSPEIDVAFFDTEFLRLWSEALAPVDTRHDTLVLRDFHVDNLMLLSDRDGVARCGLLDFQDAILGPCEYDLVSLLQDARRDLAPGLEAQLLARYCAQAPAHLGGEAAIRQRYALLGAQRHARILGVFLRLDRRDGKPRYMTFLPRVLTQFQQALDDAGLTDIRDFLNTALPGWTKAATRLAPCSAPTEKTLQMNGSSDD